MELDFTAAFLVGVTLPLEAGGFTAVFLFGVTLPLGDGDFTADFVLQTTAGLSGKIIVDGTDANSTDQNDDVQLEDASGNIAREDIKTATLTSPEKNISIFKLPKRVVKTLLTEDNNNASDTQITVRRQFVGTTTTGGVVSFTAGSNETFLAFAEKDYTMSVLTAGSGSASQGDIISVSGNIAGTGTATVTVTDNTNLGNYKEDFNYINFLTNETNLNNSKVYLFDNISGSDLYHVINKSDKVIAFHGMMTNLASIEKKNVLDLFLCEINTIADFRRYKNALYEFKPSYNNYDFIVPSKDIDKTIRKMKFSLKK